MSFSRMKVPLRCGHTVLTDHEPVHGERFWCTQCNGWQGNANDPPPPPDTGGDDPNRKHDTGQDPPPPPDTGGE